MKSLSHMLLLAMVAAAVADASAQADANPCGALRNAYGPFEYRTHKKEAEAVETFHFQPEYEHGTSDLKQYFAAGYDYMLRAFPNHHRALVAMVKNVERLKNNKPNGATYSAECYFDRAMRIAPDDMVVRILYARYLGRNGRMPDALALLAGVIKESPDDAMTQYNAGLLYLELKDYDKALAQAHAAAALGMQRNELRNGLQAAGKWGAPPPAAAASAASAAD